jgi:hypothetical protein
LKCFFKFLVKSKTHINFNHEFSSPSPHEYCESDPSGRCGITWGEKCAQVYFQQGQTAIYLQSQISQKIFEKICSSWELHAVQNAEPTAIHIDSADNGFYAEPRGHELPRPRSDTGRERSNRVAHEARSDLQISSKNTHLFVWQ